MPHDAPPPARSGIGLRAPHVGEVLATRPPVGWLEVHAENYMGGGPALRDLERIRRDYPVALHGVGLSLGTAAGIDARHLERLTRLAERLEPCFVSEHLSWSVAAGAIARKVIPGVRIRGALVQLGPHAIDRANWNWDEIHANPFFCPDAKAAAFYEVYLDGLRKEGSSIGAVIEIVAYEPGNMTGQTFETGGLLIIHGFETASEEFFMSRSGGELSFQQSLQDRVAHIDPLH